VPVPNELASRTTTRGQTHSEHDVVEASLERHDEVLTSDARDVRCTLEKAAELFLAEAVDPLHLLLLAKLNGVVGLFTTASLRWAMLARRVCATLHGTLLRVALLSLQKKLLAFTATELTDGSGITSHIFL